MVLDHFIFDNNIKRRVCIITEKEEELRQFLTEAGFTDIRLTGDLTHRPPKAEEDRWNLCCRRAAE